MAWVCGRPAAWTASQRPSCATKGAKRKTPAPTDSIRRPSIRDRAKGSARPGADPASCDTSLGRRFGKIDLAMGELMAQQADVSRGEPVPFRDHLRGEPLDEGGSQRLIASLPLVARAWEGGGVPHEDVIAHVA